MATSVPSVAQAAAPPHPTAPPPKAAPAAGQSASPTALVPAGQAVAAQKSMIPEGSPALRLKVELEVSVPVGDFRVSQLLVLEPGALVESRWSHAEDLPLAAGRVQLAWTEFEVVDTQLAARLTRLA